MPLVPGADYECCTRYVGRKSRQWSARGVEALMSAAAIGFGIALVLRFM